MHYLNCPMIAIRTELIDYVDEPVKKIACAFHKR
jgi:hypothetical protein